MSKIPVLLPILLTVIAEFALLFLAIYAVAFALDQRKWPGDAFRSSVRFTRTTRC